MTGDATTPELPRGLLEDYLAGMRVQLGELAGIADRRDADGGDLEALEQSAGQDRHDLAWGPGGEDGSTADTNRKAARHSRESRGPPYALATRSRRIRSSVPLPSATA
jgi:hypothetical protein